ncbi:MAG: tRNA pseudouridine(38-40) synthase TruA [Treponema sp.]|jgi:tRNA pseudouridine38-40 synthase|nr:tRNA pseudouridine(38-40) synthase TruA [Treponema sp.]
MTERNIKLLIAYDGTDFCGWQKQNDRRTVQECIEKALEKLHKHPVRLTGAGRTDAGVHSTGQVANFYTDIQTISPKRFAPALNSILPQDVSILSAEETADDFHARFGARSRTYQYRIIAGRSAFPHERRYHLCLRRRPSVVRLNTLAHLLHGEMDCSTFASLKNQNESRYRYIYHTVFFVQGDCLIFEITANAFLWKMVRSIVGTLLFYEEKGASLAEFVATVNSLDRSKAGPTAPAHGLFLQRVDYPSRVSDTGRACWTTS